MVWKSSLQPLLLGTVFFLINGAASKAQQSPDRPPAPQPTPVRSASQSPDDVFKYYNATAYAEFKRQR
jgi:hypothetical protein